MFLVPLHFAGALPKSGGKPAENHHLREKESCEDAFRAQVKYPDVQASSEENPAHEADPEIKPEKRTEISPK